MVSRPTTSSPADVLLPPGPVPRGPVHATPSRGRLPGRGTTLWLVARQILVAGAHQDRVLQWMGKCVRGGWRHHPQGVLPARPARQSLAVHGDAIVADAQLVAVSFAATLSDNAAGHGVLAGDSLNAGDLGEERLSQLADDPRKPLGCLAWLVDEVRNVQPAVGGRQPGAGPAGIAKRRSAVRRSLGCLQ